MCCGCSAATMKLLVDSSLRCETLALIWCATKADAASKPALATTALTASTSALRLVSSAIKQQILSRARRSRPAFRRNVGDERWRATRRARQRVAESSDSSIVKRLASLQHVAEQVGELRLSAHERRQTLATVCAHLIERQQMIALLGVVGASSCKLCVHIEQR